jgi:hypothetical protein
MVEEMIEKNPATESEVHERLDPQKVAAEEILAPQDPCGMTSEEKARINELLDEVVRGTSEPHDPINPMHYQGGQVETLDIIWAILDGLEGKITAYQAHLIGHVVRYLCRFPMKNGVEDLQKAAFYLEELVQDHVKKKKPGRGIWDPADPGPSDEDAPRG